MLAAVEAMTDANAKRSSCCHDANVAAQAAAGESLHDLSPLVSNEHSGCGRFMRQPFLHPTEDTALLSIGSFGNVPGSFLNRVSVPAQHPRGGRIERTVAWLIASGDYTCTS